jgi:hypothetical protein
MTLTLVSQVTSAGIPALTLVAPIVALLGQNGAVGHGMAS